MLMKYGKQAMSARSSVFRKPRPGGPVGHHTSFFTMLSAFLSPETYVIHLNMYCRLLQPDGSWHQCTQAPSCCRIMFQSSIPRFPALPWPTLRARRRVHVAPDIWRRWNGKLYETMPGRLSRHAIAELQELSRGARAHNFGVF